MGNSYKHNTPYSHLHTLPTMSDNQKQEKEQEFTIQPHPHPNDPSTKVEATPGLMGERQAPTASQPGPHMMSEDTASKLEEPLGRDELRKRAEELNKD